MVILFLKANWVMSFPWLKFSVVFFIVFKVEFKLHNISYSSFQFLRLTLLAPFSSTLATLAFLQCPQSSSVQSLSRVWLFATPWIAARQASLSITNSQSLLKLMSIELVMPSSHFFLCHPLLLLPPIAPSIRVISSESTLRIRWPKYWSFSQSQHQSLQWTPRTDPL